MAMNPLPRSIKNTRARALVDRTGQDVTLIEYTKSATPDAYGDLGITESSRTIKAARAFTTNTRSPATRSSEIGNFEEMSAIEFYVYDPVLSSFIATSDNINPVIVWNTVIWRVLDVENTPIGVARCLCEKVRA